MSYEATIKELAAHVRDRMKSADQAYVDLRINITGRVHDGEILIQFIYDPHGSDEVKGDSIDAVINEFLRRQGWNEKHKGLRIGYVEPTHSDDISF
jgi:hypothetical protein